MKTQIKFILLAVLAAAALIMTSCDPDDTPDNTGTLGFTITGLPSGTDASIDIAGPNSYTLNVPGSQTVTGLEAGSYTITVNSVDVDGSPYTSADGVTEQTVAVTADQTTEVMVEYEFEGSAVGIRGEWVSAGGDVADLLYTFFATDSIYANFRADGTYLVESFDTTGTKVTFEGTATQTASTEGNIFSIMLNQTSPSVLTSEGILEVYDAPRDSMYYEVVQTEPVIGATPPTPTSGFGSSNNGNLGNTNIQVFRRLQ